MAEGRHLAHQKKDDDRSFFGHGSKNKPGNSLDNSLEKSAWTHRSGWSHESTNKKRRASTSDAAFCGVQGQEKKIDRKRANEAPSVGRNFVKGRRKCNSLQRGILHLWIEVRYASWWPLGLNHSTWVLGVCHLGDGGLWTVVLEETEETLAYSFYPFQFYFWTQLYFFWLLKTSPRFLQWGGLTFVLRFHTKKEVSRWIKTPLWLSRSFALLEPFYIGLIIFFEGGCSVLFSL